ncbi:MAG: DUF3644 domain-containing protein [Xenococcus sp. (in: cyanobacteria)]
MTTAQKTRTFQKTDRAYSFLINKERKKEPFSVREFASYVGWKEKTVKTYLSKRWRVYMSKDINSETYLVQGIIQLGKEEFRQIHSQALTDTDKSPEIKILLEKSRKFALMAVSNYNNPLFEFKTHSFIVNLIIAYTALFHAIFEKNSIEYFYRDKDGNPEVIDGENKAFELTKCCQVYYKDAQNSIKANLEFLIGLRNKIEHRSLPAIDLYVEGECQAAITNYENILTQEFGERYSLGSSLAISMQLTKISQQSRINALKELQTKNYRVIKNYIDKYRDDLDDEISLSQEYRISVFLVPKLGNHAKSADMCIEFIKKEHLTKDELKEYEEAIVLIKNKTNPYKFKPGRVIELVKKTISSFNTIWLHTQCWKYYKARPKNNDPTYKGEYCGWIEGFDGYLYTQSWVNFLIEKLADQEEYEKIKTFR